MGKNPAMQKPRGGVKVCFPFPSTQPTNYKYTAGVCVPIFCFFLFSLLFFSSLLPLFYLFSSFHPSTYPSPPLALPRSRTLSLRAVVFYPLRFFISTTPLSPLSRLSLSPQCSPHHISPSNTLHTCLFFNCPSTTTRWTVPLLSPLSTPIMLPSFYHILLTIRLTVLICKAYPV